MARPHSVYSQYTTPMCLGLNTAANQDHNLCGAGKDRDIWGCNRKNWVVAIKLFLKIKQMTKTNAGLFQEDPGNHRSFSGIIC